MEETVFKAQVISVGLQNPIMSQLCCWCGPQCLYPKLIGPSLHFLRKGQMLLLSGGVCLVVS